MIHVSYSINLKLAHSILSEKWQRILFRDIQFFIKQTEIGVYTQAALLSQQNLMEGYPPLAVPMAAGWGEMVVDQDHAPLGTPAFILCYKEHRFQFVNEMVEIKCVRSDQKKRETLQRTSHCHQGHQLVVSSHDTGTAAAHCSVCSTRSRISVPVLVYETHLSPTHVIGFKDLLSLKKKN